VSKLDRRNLENPRVSYNLVQLGHSIKGKADFSLPFFIVSRGRVIVQRASRKLLRLWERMMRCVELNLSFWMNYAVQTIDA
jgi:hypothetical protein